jgi:hypothetical protein
MRSSAPVLLHGFTMDTTTGLRPFDSWAGPEALGTMWTLTRGRQTLRCAVTTHRLGWELRALQNDDLRRSQVVRSQDEAFDLSKPWEAEARVGGWR